MGREHKDMKLRETRQHNRLNKRRRREVDQLENEIIDQSFVIINEVMRIIKTQISEDQYNHSSPPPTRGIVNARTNMPLTTHKTSSTHSDSTPNMHNVTIEVNHPSSNRSVTEPTFQYQSSTNNSANVNLNQGSQMYPGMENSIPRSNSRRNAAYDRLRGPVQSRNAPSIVNPTQMNNARRNQNLNPQRTEQSIVGRDAFQFANRLVSQPSQTPVRTSRPARSVSRNRSRGSVPQVASTSTSSMRAPSVAIAA